MDIDRILVPVSFAPSNKKAFRMAAMMASAFGARLYVLNAFRTPPHLFFSVGALHDEDGGREREEKVAQLDEFVRRELDLFGMSLDVREIEVEDENAVDAILRVAKEKGVDLIVLGHHEESRLEHLLFGRNIDRIVDRAPCNVLVTRTKLFDRPLENPPEPEVP